MVSQRGNILDFLSQGEESSYAFFDIFKVRISASGGICK